MHKRRCLPIVIVSTLAILTLSCHLSLLPRPSSWATPTPIASRHITSTSLSLREQWRKSGVVIYPNRREPSPLISVRGGIAFADHALSSPGRMRVQVLDGTTGQLCWEVQDLPYEDSLAADPERLYVAASAIRAYDLDDGTLLWQVSKGLPGHTMHSLYPVGDELYMYTYEDLYVFDAGTGARLDVHKMPEVEDTQLILRTEQADYWEHIKKKWVTDFWAVDRSSGQEKWRAELNGLVNLWPVFKGENILLEAGTPKSQIYLLDANTGTIKWHNEQEFVSNFAVMDGVVYALRSDAALVGLDLASGRELGSIQFEPASTDTFSNGYWLAASEGRLFVSFGDSHELVALGP